MTLAWQFCIGVALMLPTASFAQEFIVVRTEPSDGTVDVDLDPLIQIHTSMPFDAASLTSEHISLHDEDGDRVDYRVRGDLGGVITVSVESVLRPDTEYELKVTEGVVDRRGNPIQPMMLSFRTTAEPPGVPRDDIESFQFEKTVLDRMDGVFGLALAGPNLLCSCTWRGELYAYPLGPNGQLAGERRLILELDQRFNAIVADPRSTADHVILYLAHDGQQELSLGPNDFSGSISRIDIRGDEMTITRLITGMPTGDHPASGLVFGPDGRLFISQGALTMLGEKPDRLETYLSAATLVLDLDHERFEDDEPIDVRSYSSDDRDAGHPLQLYATGIREAFDLCWHRNGQLYAGVNMNDSDESAPGRGEMPAINARPDEMMIRIVEGSYYGHPNPTRDQWVLLGGNPTAGDDPWEVASLPVGTMPDDRFDPDLLIRNLARDHGPSANGVCEWIGEGVLNGRLLFCFYTATRGIHTYLPTQDGSQVTDHQPLVDAENRTLRFGAPLDIAFDKRGWLYVADFSAPSRGDSGQGGGIWIVRPLDED